MKVEFGKIENLLANVQGLLRKSVIFSPETELDTLLTDSRSLSKPDTTLFFAINTPGGNDGHRFIPHLYDKGVRNFIIETSLKNFEDFTDANFIEVSDSVEALHTIVSSGRIQTTEYVAITGSRGKTTLKEWLFQLLDPLKNVARSPRSFNSKIGVPASMWLVDKNSQIALIEAGISTTGEMSRLAKTIDPDTVIFTSLTDEHSEGFRSMEEKAFEKTLIATGDNVKTIIFEGGDPIISDAIYRHLNAKGNTGNQVKTIDWSFENPGATLYIEKLPISNGVFSDSHYGQENEDFPAYTFKVIYEGKSFNVAFKEENEGDLKNFASALAFMLHEGIEPQIITQRFLSLKKSGTRLNVTDGVNDSTVIFDSYPSDLNSLPQALDFLMRRKGEGRKSVVVMTDIFSEAHSGEKDYETIASLLKQRRIDRFIGVGEDIFRFGSLFSKSKFPSDSLFFKSEKEFLEALTPSDFIKETILLKGSPSHPLDQVKEMLEARSHETVLEVNLDAVVKNFNYFRRKVPQNVGVIGMVKASGYGTGSYEIAKTLQDCGAAYLAVAVVDEGVELRNKGISMPIMVMNPKVVNYSSLFSNSLEPEIYSFEILGDVVAEARKRGVKDYPVHIKLDTGMHRMGFLENELPKLLEIIKAQNNVRVSSLFSHLATADCPDLDDYTFTQLHSFEKMTNFLTDGLGYEVKRHILNSAGILRFPRYHFDMVRLGIGLYGVETLPPELEEPLSTVATLRTVIISLREWEKGITIGYGRKGVVGKRSMVATIPVGYADGINRKFGNGNLKVLVNGHEAPTIGNVCMDACMIDVTGIDCKTGDPVEIFGNNNSIQNLASALETIPYEILTSVSPRVKRVYFRE